MGLVGIDIHDPKDIQEFEKIKFFQIMSNISKNVLHLYTKLGEKNVRFVVHSLHSINIAKNWAPSDWWVIYLLNEIAFCEKINAVGLVIHVGKQLNLLHAEAINNMYTLLLYLYRKTKYSNVKLILETPAGQGTELLANITDFCGFLNKFYSSHSSRLSSRFGCCIDTCHLYAAGYDLGKKQIVDAVFKEIHNTIGFNKLLLCHLNDSFYPLFSKKDRHAPIGNGYIGKKMLLYIAKLLRNVPIILEYEDAHLNVHKIQTSIS